MKVLVATHEGQGDEAGDYCFTVDGELVTPVHPDCSDSDRCGCARGFAGLASSRATTTAVVAELPEFNHHMLRQALYDSLDRGGWFQGLDHDERIELVDDHLEVISTVTHFVPEGTVIRRQGQHIHLRHAG